jgi:hypothetical protein
MFSKSAIDLLYLTSPSCLLIAIALFGSNVCRALILILLED